MKSTVWLFVMKHRCLYSTIVIDIMKLHKITINYLWVLLGHVLFGELGQLHHFRDDIFLFIAVGAVDQGAGHSIQDGLIC